MGAFALSLRKRAEMASKRRSSAARVTTRAPERSKRLTQPAQWKDFLPAEGVQTIDQHNVEIAVQARVLESVIEQQNISGWKLVAQDLGGFIAIGADADRRNCMAQEDLRFIAGEGGGDFGAGGENQIPGGRAAPIAAGENGGRITAVL